jgi:hypothetical protein
MGRAMSTEFVRRMQNLYQIDDGIRRAELVGDKAAIRIKLVDGLVESCLLLQEMLRSKELGGTKPNPEGWQFFQGLVKEKKLHEFLDQERKFLSMTALEPVAVDLIVGALGQMVNLMIAQKGRIDISWWSQLDKLSHLVCDRASKEAGDLSRRPFIRRAFLAAGGSTVVMLNLGPPLAIPPEVVAGSISVGTWLIGKAAEGALDHWVKGQKRESER